MVGNGVLELHEIWDLIVQMTLALAKLKKERLLHRDIRPENILYGTDEDENPEFKLIDLGSCAKCNPEKGIYGNGVFGCMKYVPPEAFKGL